MKEKIFVKPKDGKRVIDPATKRVLPSEGASVEKTSYWMRRLANGEIEIVQQSAPVAKPKVEIKKNEGGE